MHMVLRTSSRANNFALSRDNTHRRDDSLQKALLPPGRDSSRHANIRRIDFAAYGLPRSLMWPFAASSADISRNDHVPRRPPLRLRLHALASATASGLISASGLRPSMRLQIIRTRHVSIQALCQLGQVKCLGLNDITRHLV